MSPCCVLPIVQSASQPATHQHQSTDTLQPVRCSFGTIARRRGPVCHSARSGPSRCRPVANPSRKHLSDRSADALSGSLPNGMIAPGGMTHWRICTDRMAGLPLTRCRCHPVAACVCVSWGCRVVSVGARVRLLAVLWSAGTTQWSCRSEMVAGFRFEFTLVG